ncbi:MAG: hypothetical protein KAZ88_08745 [Acidimicrobiia bacterium]|nr:hypothetical protein [Acidimicrobiia bacterium]
MPLTLDLAAESITRLQAEADRRGISVEALVDQLVASLPAERAGSDPKKLRFFKMGASTSGRSAADADELLAEGFGRP